MEKKKLFIGIPAYDGKISIGAAVSLSQLLVGHSPALGGNAIHVVMLPGESHVNRARNRLVKLFLNTDCTHLLFVDSDISFSPQNIDALLARDCPIVAGLYAKKELGEPQWVVNQLPGTTEPDETGLIEVMFAGTGFMLIARTVFEKFIQELRDEIEYDDDSSHGLGVMWNFFHCGVRKRRFLTEDWWFCDVWKDFGGQIFADTRVQLGHTGTINYPVRAPAPEIQP